MKLHQRFACLSLIFVSYLSDLEARQLWNDNSFSFLKGNHYEVGDSDKTVFTLEHVSGHTWGDVFLFVDRLRSQSGDSETYFEISPRLSFNKLTDVESGNGLITDLLLAFTWESGESNSNSSSFENQLIGPSVDLNVPGFSVFQLSLFHRNNESRANNWQMTYVWALPFELGDESFLYDGFIDWTSSNEDTHSSMNFTSQLKWNIGNHLFNNEEKLYLGIEYVYWQNKYGIPDSPLFNTDESNVNLLLKAHF